MRHESLLLFCLLLILIFPHAAQGQEENNYGTWSLYWENDYLAKTDSNYTNGGRLTWTSPWISWKPDGDSVPTRHHTLVPFIDKGDALLLLARVSIGHVSRRRPKHLHPR